MVSGTVQSGLNTIERMWFRAITDNVASPELGFWTVVVLLAAVAVGWFGWRPLFRLAETSFWSLNALAVQPGYAFAREALRHLTERMWGKKLTPAGRARLRSANSIGAAVILSA